MPHLLTRYSVHVMVDVNTVAFSESVSSNIYLVFSPKLTSSPSQFISIEHRSSILPFSCIGYQFTLFLVTHINSLFYFQKCI